MTKHTPGPWHYQENADKYTHIIRTKTDGYICGLGQDSSGLAEANARLIASAPCLYEALKDALIEMEVSLKNCDQEEKQMIEYRIDKTKKAIAKAEGRC